MLRCIATAYALGADYNLVQTLIRVLNSRSRRNKVELRRSKNRKVATANDLALSYGLKHESRILNRRTK